jgi:hypothetical protein
MRRGNDSPRGAGELEGGVCWVMGFIGFLEFLGFVVLVALAMFSGRLAGAQWVRSAQGGTAAWRVHQL